jgi:hypothetical protein
VPVSSSYDYAVVRIVPSVERGECMNVGVILFCRTRRFLGARIELNEERVRAFAPDIDMALIKQQLAHLVQVSEGKDQSGPIGQLSQSERFHWLVSPRSTVIQVSAAHSGLSDDPETALDKLVNKMVRL